MVEMEWRHFVTAYLKHITVKLILICIVLATWFGFVNTTSIELTCPSLLSARLVSKKLCVPSTYYHCLRVDNTNSYSQNCIDSEPLEKGTYPILGDKNVIYPEYCPSGSYQPTPMFTNERNECWYIKSNCTGEGQVVHTNGSGTQDRTCRCDYTKGFTFITRPQADCYCVPSKEDCSCYRQACPDTYSLTQDYECADITSVTQFRCPGILWREEKIKESKDKSVIPIEDVEKRDKSLTLVIFFIGLTLGFILTIFLRRIETGCIDHKISLEKGSNSKEKDQQQDKLKQPECYTGNCTNGISTKQKTNTV